MIVLGLPREAEDFDSVVALTPSQCKLLHTKFNNVRVIVQPSKRRCFEDREYIQAGILVQEDLAGCDVLMGISSIPVDCLLANKTYMLFTEPRRMRLQDSKLLKTMMEKEITLVSYERLLDSDNHGILSPGFFSGVVGAHLGVMAFGKRTGTYNLEPVVGNKSFRNLLHKYFGLRLPNLKIAVTGSGRVAAGVLEIMNLLGLIEVEPDEFLERQFDYPTYVHLKDEILYRHKQGDRFNKEAFRVKPSDYKCTFDHYVTQTNILINGLYWKKGLPPLFSLNAVKKSDFRVKTIVDIPNHENGNVPCNISQGTYNDPVYGVDKFTIKRTKPFSKTGIDIIGMDSLFNQLPRDSSKYFGQQFIDRVLNQVLERNGFLISNATILENGIPAS